MARVKCQYCWKIFDVPDDFINKQRQCIFCQRMTVAQPVELENRPKDSGMALSFQTLLKILNISTVFLLAVAVLNTILLIGAIRKTGEGFDREGWSLKQQEVNEKISQIQDSLQKTKAFLLQSEANQIPPDEFGQVLLGGIRPSVQLILDKLAQAQAELERIQSSLESLKQDQGTEQNKS